MRWFVFLLALFLAAPDPANAAPVFGLLAAAGKLTILGLSVKSLGFRLLVTVGLSILARTRRKTPRPPGIRIDNPTGGGTNPQTFLLGRTASEGNMSCPTYSHGTVGGTPLAYLTVVRDFGDVAGISLRRVMIDDEYVTLGTTAHPDYGLPITDFNENGTDYAWVKFYDGTQTVADPFMLSAYGSHPDFPWSADMVGTGVPHAIFTFRSNTSRWRQAPKIRCEFDDIPLYDPRKDTTVGGSGLHRWGDISTYEATDNPQVMKYNIHRGIVLPDGNIWGGEAVEEDLPLSNWFAAMNACDLVADGETMPQYQAGLEVGVNEKPADVLEEFDKACAGQSVEIGGTANFFDRLHLSCFHNASTANLSAHATTRRQPIIH
jgi:hypothetical protein